MSDGAPITVPYATPIYGPPPYRMLEARIVLVSWEVPRNVAAQFVPPPLKLPDGPIMVSAFVGDMHQLPYCGKFHEGGIQIPTLHGERAGSYAAYLWTSADEAIFVGREVYGMPKVACTDTPLTWRGNEICGTVTRHGREVVGLDLAIEAEVDPDEAMRGGSRLSVRFIPDPTGRTAGRCQVLAIETSEFRVTEAWRGRAALRLPVTTQSHTHALLPDQRQPLIGYLVSASWVLDAAEVLAEVDG